jgi:hypothetical protein
MMKNYHLVNVEHQLLNNYLLEKQQILLQKKTPSPSKKRFTIIYSI